MFAELIIGSAIPLISSILRCLFTYSFRLFKLLIRHVWQELDSTTSEYRYMPNISESPAVTNIYGDKIAITIWTEKPECTIIENAAAAKAYKSYFDVMWTAAKK